MHTHTHTHIHTHTHTHTLLQRVTQILVVLLIVAGLFMFTFQSTTFDLEGFILVRQCGSATLCPDWTTFVC